MSEKTVIEGVGYGKEPRFGPSVQVVQDDLDRIPNILFKVTFPPTLNLKDQANTVFRIKVDGKPQTVMGTTGSRDSNSGQFWYSFPLPKGSARALGKHTLEIDSTQYKRALGLRDLLNLTTWENAQTFEYEVVIARS